MQTSPKLCKKVAYYAKLFSFALQLFVDLYKKVSSMRRRLLVTMALPYANGALHLGHLLEAIQADIWVRFQRLMMRDCLFVSGTDAHGTPIMLQAKRENMPPEAFILRQQITHASDFKDFHVQFDCFHNTHTDDNQQLVYDMFARLNAKNAIIKQPIEQMFDPQKQLFLPDRFVKGYCPRCDASDQYGDHCEACGAIYATTDLKQPYSALSGAKPIQKTAQHYFFCLDRYQSDLQDWLAHTYIQPAVQHKLNEWLHSGLKKWDISRSAPYFGFKIPGSTDQYFYVWMDAPIGYMSGLNDLCQTRNDLSFDDYWKKNSQAELYHFIGKDIIYFHALFWPAMLMCADFRLPNGIFAHGFLNVNRHKMSKSRGTFMTARHYLDHLDPAYLRYYFASKLGASVEDIDLDWEDFATRVNTDLVGKWINIASRCARFINRDFDSLLSDRLLNPTQFEHYVQAGEAIATLYEARTFSKAMRAVMRLADQANQFIEQQQPWALSKQKPTDPAVQLICTMGLNLFALLTLYLKPVLPVLTEHCEAFLNHTYPSWDARTKPLLSHRIYPFKPLLQRVTAQQLATLCGDTQDG